MKVLLVNGSSRKNGCTNKGLEIIAETLKENGVDSEIFWIGNKVNGCLACRYCKKDNKGCIQDDVVNRFAELANTADGFIFGSPVYFAGPNGNIKSFMDRFFYSVNKESIRLKPFAVITSARRSGETATYDQLIKFAGINEMPIISSTYWNNIHGNTPEEILKDLEGVQTLKNLANNMAYFLKCIDAAKEVKKPVNGHVMTNFIRD